MLTTYQALTRAGDDALSGQPKVPGDRISFTVLINAAADTVTTAHGIFPDVATDQTGAIARAVRAHLLPVHRRQRVKARTCNNPTSKYGPNAGQHPQQAQSYTIHTTVTFFEHGLSNRSRR
ncbi:hypothetical protein [Streptomyces sp. YGL11-2]|uniref:hypothetical protein n=1 Tax=Streptomyces sp. YGL11-2 TaxID=3414028 RepID=UPI003CF03E1C